MGFGVWGWGVGFGVWGLGFGVSGDYQRVIGFRVWALGPRVCFLKHSAEEWRGLGV